MEESQITDIGEKIVQVLKTIFDPEIPVDIYELGLIYDVMVNDHKEAKILMTLTSPNCPVAETLPKEVIPTIKIKNKKIPPANFKPLFLFMLLLIVSIF